MPARVSGSLGRSHHQLPYDDASGSGLVNGDRQPEHRIGLVGGVRDVVFSTDRLDDLDGWLIVNARRLVEGEQGYMYHFTVLHQTSTLIEGRASIFVKATL